MSHPCKASSACSIFPVIVHNSEDTLEIAEITRKKMNEKIKDLECVKKKVKIAPHDYSKEQTTASRPIKALTVRKYDEIEWKNLLIANDNLIANCLSKDVFYIATNSKLTVSRFTEMPDAYTVVQARCLELKAELSKLHDKVQKDDHTELVKHFSNLEVNHLNLQLKYQNLKESFGNNTSPPARDAPDFDSVFVIEKMKASIQGKDNAFKKLRMQITQLKEPDEANSWITFRALDFQITQLTEKVTVLQEQNELFRAENAKIKQHYKELYDSIKITRAKHIEQTTALLTENENLKAQIHENLKCITMDSVKPRVLAPGRYAIDVEPIPPHNRNNREVHLDYLKHLKESVETLCEIVEEAKVERPLDRSLESACLKLNTLKNILSTFTFEDQCETSNNNAYKHVEKLNIQKTNVPVIPSTGVNSCTDASGSQPRSNTKKNRISPAKSVNKKKVEEHPRTNKSSLKIMNRVDSSIAQAIGDRSRPRNFVKRFTEKVRFRNDHFATIMGYGDYVIGDSVISKEAFIHDEFLPNLLVVQILHEQILVMASSFKPLELRIFHQKSVLRTPQQNGVVERRNRTLVEAAKTILIFSKAPMFLWAKAVATA
ncbi:integrase, catalytic region, zinc finger, CCHC-type containing protein [Tanacetum coccineum]|uniref:Integrase, catalytic region, zinc finger, CCHC-type containing protein n=1 Tax=Tanacetum coccineum TaxID=301880 RepID=A0ABQ5B4X7_9ASTR